MNFQTEYKNLVFNITLESVNVNDISLLLTDKFNKLPNKTMIEIKKGMLIPYNLVIKSTRGEEERTHYWSNILLTSEREDLVEDLSAYLEDYDILESIIANWQKLDQPQEGPHKARALS